MAHRYFCTYFDAAYLHKGLALYNSLRSNHDNFTLFVLCLDDQTSDILARLNLSGIRTISIGRLEAADPEFAATSSSRNRIEYYWTSTPVLPLYLLREFQEIDLIMYLDSDLYFFSSPEAAFNELGDASIYLTPHRFAPSRAHIAESSGYYNVGAVGFRNDSIGRACLERWRAQCLDWCYQRSEPGRFGDQKYLDDWPTAFPGVVVSENLGCNLAPWNMGNYEVTHAQGKVLVDGQELVFFHFHGFRYLGYGFYELSNPNYPVNGTLRKHVFAPYVREIQQTMQLAPSLFPSARTIAGSTGSQAVLLALALKEGRLLWTSRRG